MATAPDWCAPQLPAAPRSTAQFPSEATVLALKPAARSRRSTRAFFAAYLRPHRAELEVAIVLTLLLGLVAAPIPMMLGLALQVIADPEAAGLRLEDLFGPFAGSWVVRWSGRETASAAELLAGLPLSIAVTVIVKAVVSAIRWFSCKRLGERIAIGMCRDLIDDYMRLDPAALRGEERHYGNHGYRQAVALLV